MMSRSKVASLTGNNWVGGLPAFRIAIPSWGIRTVEKTPAVSTLSRDELMSLFGDWLIAPANSHLTERERAEVAMTAKLRQAICQ